ncbi:MAG: hypothetical protein AAF985_17695 [Bacteroidota bacterium]
MLQQKTSSILTGLSLLLFCVLFFHACVQKEQISTVVADQNIFEQHQSQQLQKFQAPDLGNGTYQVTGKHGTLIEISDALVNSTGQRVRGAVDIELIEIYTVADMILHRKQTLADYDGQNEILESGGEVFVKVYQNGEELSADGAGEMSILLPTANTGGANENMELFYGEETGEQIIWKPTGEKIPVINRSSILRADREYYLVMIENILGWINVDIVYAAQGEDIDCIRLNIDCELPCEIHPENTVAAIHIGSLNSAFELTHSHGTTFELCSIEGEGFMPLGGLSATFVVIIDCGDGRVYYATVTTTLTPGNHTQEINCEVMQVGSPDEVETALQNLL